MGEFGAYIAANPASRARFYKACREALDEAGIGWAMSDWKAGFKYWDDKSGQPVPGMRQAIFPDSKRETQNPKPDPGAPGRNISK